MKRHLISAALGAGVALTGLPAHAIDVAPGDYAMMPAGTDIGLLYLQHSEATKLNYGGVDVPASEVTANVAVLRGLHYTEIAGEPVMFQAVLPFGDFSTAQIGGTDMPTSEGVGDLTLGVSYWPVKPSNPETGTTVGVTAFLSVPTGKYDIDDISFGNGAWTFTPQVALIQGLGGGAYLDAVADVAFSFDHTENGVEVSRDPAAQVQVAFRKQFGPTASMSIGYSGQFGGEIDYDGVYGGLKTRRDQIRLYANTFLSQTVQVQGMLAKDLHVEDGFKNDVVAELRLMKLF
jgi:Protein involved in meta-pathway of phenol degradation